MRRRTNQTQPHVYVIYAIYDNDIDDRIYKISYCHAYKWPQIQRYYANNLQRQIAVIFDYFTNKYTHLPIEYYIDEMDDKTQPVIIHRYSHEGNRKRIKQAKSGDYFIKSIFNRNGNISELKILGLLLDGALNEPYSIGDLQDEGRTEYEKETNPDYIPLDFWNYGLKIKDLPEHLQEQYKNYMQD